MSVPEWRRLGYLTPDAPECQRDVWAFAARDREHLADALGRLAGLTAEPSWGATLGDAARAAGDLGRDLAEEAGEEALLRLSDDAIVRGWDGVVAEIVASEHVPSLLVTGFVHLGELGSLPLRLLEDVAGPHARVLCGRVASADEHRILGRLAAIVETSSFERRQLRRMLAHVNEQLGTLYGSWRQTFHVLGLDAETLGEAAERTLREAYAVVGLDVTAADVRPLRL